MTYQDLLNLQLFLYHCLDNGFYGPLGKRELQRQLKEVNRRITAIEDTAFQIALEKQIRKDDNNE